MNLIHLILDLLPTGVCERGVCVGVGVCEEEGEGGREGSREGGREKAGECVCIFECGYKILYLYCYIDC